MQSKFGLVALSVMATLVLFGGNTAEAKSNETAKKTAETAKTTTPEPVYVTVKPGDNLSDIATAQSTSYMRMFNANDAITNPDLIFVDQKLRVPTNEEQLPDRLAQFSAEQQAQIIASAASQSSAAPVASAAPATNSVVTSQARGSSAGNGYVWGQCTWYVKNMRPDLPNNLGNGGSWVANAAAQGLPTGNTPRVGAVAEEPGHVAYVEAVNGGMISISEMNYAGGVGQVHRRTVPASNYRYIY